VPNVVQLNKIQKFNTLIILLMTTIIIQIYTHLVQSLEYIRNYESK